MKETPIANECIRALEDIETTIILLFDICNIKRQDCFDGVVKQVQRCNDILTYRLFPYVHIYIDDGKTENEFKDFFTRNKLVGNSESIWNIINSYKEVTLKNLENEFFNVCPSLDAKDIRATSDVLLYKFKKVRNVPNIEYFDYESLINNDKFIGKFNNIDVSKYDIEKLALDISMVVEKINIDVKNIVEMYQSIGKIRENKPQQKKKGPSFRDIIQYNDKDKLLERLHFLIDGKSGARVGAVLFNAWYIKGFLTEKPTQQIFETEFKLIGGWSAINNYINNNDEKALVKANQIVIFE